MHLVQSSGGGDYRSTESAPPSARNVVPMLQSAERGVSRITSTFLRHGIRRMIEHRLFEEHPLPSGTSAILCSEWLSDRLIAAGTRCNKLLVYDAVNKTCTEVPHAATPRVQQDPVAVQRGIHDMAKNPSKNLFATSGLHSNDVVVYSMPGFNPICIGKNGHGREIFGIEWIDDETLLSGGGDGTLSVWLVSEKEVQRHELDISLLEPLVTKSCRMCSVIRTLNIQSSSRLLVLSNNFLLHEWDLSCFRQVFSHRLPNLRSMNVMAHCPSRNLHIIGSNTHLTLLDGSSLAVVRNVITLNQAKLSLCVQEDILSYCTGYGTINFFDIVAGKHMDYSMCVCPDQASLFTHTYDWSGTRLFVGGCSAVGGASTDRNTWLEDERDGYAALLQ